MSSPAVLVREPLANIKCKRAGALIASAPVFSEKKREGLSDKNDVVLQERQAVGAMRPSLQRFRRTTVENRRWVMLKNSLFVPNMQNLGG
jgi:hypothetical protein